MPGTSEKVATLATMSPAQLRAEWRQLYKRTAPEVTPDLLRRGLANRMQEKAHGKLAAACKRELDRVVADLRRGSGAALPPKGRIKPGTLLVRDWGGASHHVLVREEGDFLYKDVPYRSLSIIAREITGARWSGPRFFGLRSKRVAADG